MKKILVLLITAVMILSVFSGCGDDRVKFSSEEEMIEHFTGVYEFADSINIISGDTMLEIHNIADLLDVEKIDSYLDNELKDADINADLELSDYVQYFPDNIEEYELTYDVENSKILFDDSYIIAVEEGIKIDNGGIRTKNDDFSFSNELLNKYYDFLITLYGVASDSGSVFISHTEFLDETIKLMPSIKNWKFKEELVGIKIYKGSEGFYNLSDESLDLHIYSENSTDTSKVLRVRLYNDDGIMVASAEDERTNRDLKEAINFAHAAFSDKFNSVGADELYDLYNENREYVNSPYLGSFYEYELIENSVRYYIMELDDQLSVTIREWNK